MSEEGKCLTRHIEIPLDPRCPDCQESLLYTGKDAGAVLSCRKTHPKDHYHCSACDITWPAKKFLTTKSDWEEQIEEGKCPADHYDRSDERPLKCQMCGETTVFRERYKNALADCCRDHVLDQWWCMDCRAVRTPLEMRILPGLKKKTDEDRTPPEKGCTALHLRMGEASPYCPDCGAYELVVTETQRGADGDCLRYHPEDQFICNDCGRTCTAEYLQSHYAMVKEAFSRLDKAALPSNLVIPSPSVVESLKTYWTIKAEVRVPKNSAPLEILSDVKEKKAEEPRVAPRHCTWCGSTQLEPVNTGSGIKWACIPCSSSRISNQAVGNVFVVQKQETEKQKQEEKEESTMDLNTNAMMQKMMSKMFRKVDNVVWDLMTGKLGVSTKDGIKTLETDADGDFRITDNLFDQFGLPIPAFAQNTPIEQIKPGDLILRDRDFGWVVSVPKTTSKGKLGKSFVLLKPNGDRGEWSPPKTQSIGFDTNGAMVVRSLINMLPGGNLGGLQSGLMPLLLMTQMTGGDSGSALEEMLPILLFSQMGVNAGTPDGTNPMAGMMAGGMGSIMMPMMMMKMLKGNKAGSPGNPAAKSAFGNFFDTDSK